MDKPKTIAAQVPAPAPVPVISAVSAPSPKATPRRQTRPIAVPNLAPAPRLLER